MRILALAATIFLLVSQAIVAQCDLAPLQVINTANQVLFADDECTDADGWTHYYNSASHRILVSIKKNGQDIGSIGLGMAVQAGTLAGFSTGAFNLSNADYIDNDVWVVTNRYWQITGANPIAAPVQVRFYFSTVDVSDIATTVDDFGFFVDEPDDLYMFTIGNGSGLYPLSTVTQPAAAVLTIYDQVPGPAPDWSSGNFNGYPYGEFEASTLDIGGGAGFLIFQQNPPLAVSGNISKTNSIPVPEATVQAAAISIDTTDAAGNYTCGTLLTGSSYEIVPSKDINHAEYITVADLIAISRHILGIELLTTPYQLIAADGNKSASLNIFDIVEIRNVLLGTLSSFPNNTSWRFVPGNYVFPDPTNPTVFPESIFIDILLDSLYGQDFIGVKIGDVVDESPANPPALNTTFSLPNLNACNPGDTVSFDLTVQDFQNIRGFQFTLEWDTDVLDFLSGSNFNLTGFTPSSIGTAAVADGALTFAWFNAQSSGSTVPNGTAVCRINFVASGSTGDSTPLDFTGSVTDLLLFHQNLSQVVPGTVPGSFIIDNNSSIFGAGAVQPSGCNGEPVGAIDLQVTGGTPPLSYEWSNGATTQDLSGLPAGEYQVTISDASATCPLVLIFEVPLPAPITVDANIFDMSCPFVVDGAIDLDISGGIPPLDYEWSNGSHSQAIDDLYEGSYTVTVTDAVGCTATGSFDIENPNKISPVVSVTNASYLTSPNGSVIISSINGGTGPFSFLWNTGATTQSLTGLLPGDYIVTITDGLGCQHVYGYEVYGLFTLTNNVNGSLTGAGLFPNPAAAGGPVQFGFKTKSPGEITATIFSSEGKTVSRSVFEVQAGLSDFQIAAPAVTGFYFIQLDMDGLPAGRLKLVVQ
ncbi:MAG: hypothetical protein HY842_04655 [Bacteroidetes bacterium]|nr:hypothetical protein [Bacteroidota bacterium]